VEMQGRISAQAVSTATQTNSSFANRPQTSSSITVHSHSLPPNTPQASISRISSYGDLRRRESVIPPFIPPSAIRVEQPRSRLLCPTRDYTSPRLHGSRPRQHSPPLNHHQQRATLDPLCLPAQCGFVLYPLPAFLHTHHHHHQRLLLLVCRRRGWEARWWLRNPPRARSSSISPTPPK
jgi:hypothetical protein